MNVTIPELQRKRSEAVNNMRQIHEVAETEGRDLTGEEQMQYDRWKTEVNRLSGGIKRQKEIESEEAYMKTADDPVAHQAEAEGGPTDREAVEAEERAERAFTAYVRGQEMGPEERATLVTGQSELGGMFVPPPRFRQDILNVVDDQIVIRERADVEQVAAGQNFGVPYLETDSTDFQWTTELAMGNEATVKFGNRELECHPAAKQLSISKTLLRASPRPLRYLTRRMGAVMARTGENAYVLGNGVNKPLGVFVASNNGISTSRDFAGNNTTTVLDDRTFVQAPFKIKPMYRRRAVWLMHSDIISDVAVMRDSNGQYLWKESMRADQPATLSGRPVLESDFCPNTKAADAYVAVLGDFQYYQIIEAIEQEMWVQRLIELKALENKDLFLFRWEGDGMPVLEEAFSRIKMASV